MITYKVILSASYTIEADNEDDAINEAQNELVDEMRECGVPATMDSLALIRQIFSSNAEEMDNSSSDLGLELEPYVYHVDESTSGVNKRMLETFGGELEKNGWRKKK